MLGDKAAGNYTYKMMKAIQTHLTLSLSISQPNDEKLMVPRDILISYVTGAHLGMIMSWLKRGMIYTPHFMAMQLTRLIILGAHTAAGLEGLLKHKKRRRSSFAFLLIKCNVMYSLFIKTFNNFYN